MCSLENRILCQGENSILRLENMLIHPISITHEDTIMPKKIRKIFRKSPRPTIRDHTGLCSLNNSKQAREVIFRADTY